MTRLIRADDYGHVSSLPPGASAYVNDGCRCEGCRAGQAASQARLRVKYRTRREDFPIPHGTDNGYTNYRCKCDQCRAAHTAAARRRRKAAS